MDSTEQIKAIAEKAIADGRFNDAAAAFSALANAAGQGIETSSHNKLPSAVTPGGVGGPIGEGIPDSEGVYPVKARLSQTANITPELYKKMYAESMEDPDGFWARLARENLFWFRDFDKVRSGGFVEGDISWFEGGQTNISYNCVDRHLPARSEQLAIIWEGDDPNNVVKVTYGELAKNVSRMANVLKSAGVTKGDTVALYLPNTPEAVYAMLACTRIGAPHSVVFAGFSADALRDRINDAKSKVVITADQSTRGGKVIPLKKIVDEACLGAPSVSSVIVLQRTDGTGVNMVAGRDVWMHEEMAKARPYCPPEHLDSEDTSFLLYTSGSTGKPKGVVHTTAGYLLYAMMTTKWTFDVHAGDMYACVADIGWITGHSYIVYGPLALGATTFMFESTPTYPTPARYWQCVERHRLSVFYTAPTAIRALMKTGEEYVKAHDLSSLRVLGTVGEPINPEAWKWYHDVVGAGKAAIVDTYWQTESGGHLLTPLPGVHRTKPGAAVAPFFGQRPLLLDEKTGVVLAGNDVQGVLVFAQPWPSITRTVFGDHQRYLNTYMRPYPGYYFSGDGAIRDKDGFLWITGRVDDVINTSGHRLGTAEIESSLVGTAGCSEAAVIGIPHPVKGQGIFAYVSFAAGSEVTDDVLGELKLAVRKAIGPFATPDYIVPTPGLPKTRSGKIMRRLLRKIAVHETAPEQLGDVSTLADPTVVGAIIDAVGKYGAPKTSS